MAKYSEGDWKKRGIPPLDLGSSGNYPQGKQLEQMADQHVQRVMAAKKATGPSANLGHFMHPKGGYK